MSTIQKLSYYSEQWLISSGTTDRLCDSRSNEYAYMWPHVHECVVNAYIESYFSVSLQLTLY